jgi:hypothetical protein
MQAIKKDAEKKNNELSLNLWQLEFGCKRMDLAFLKCLLPAYIVDEP